MEEKKEITLDLKELRKMKAKDAFNKWKEFAEQPPTAQLRFWYSFYKPILISLFWAIFPALAVAALMKYGGKYTDFEIEIVTVLVFISVRVNNVYSVLSRMSEKNNGLKTM
jgi:hypothetical protein